MLKKCTQYSDSLLAACIFFKGHFGLEREIERAYLATLPLTVRWLELKWKSPTRENGHQNLKADL